MKTFYECELCGTQYESEQECLKCEEQGVKESNYNIGDEVYLKLRYPPQNDKPFVSRTIINKFPYGHKTGFELNEGVQIGKSLSVGFRPPLYEDIDKLEPATDEHFFQIGDRLTKDMIDADR